ncbi:hypothetical protein B0H03_11943 [Rathayibacter iranicus NCPPB 2253 = VKM Ac-1602]|uniref:Uncharacterized protein n=1 Tax=Rathayibacter iranicus NCPPB 2253 = VKM Ac-1602 TaxID=1328868 RepID=A0ABX5L8K4_9MICO|nr:hypothetical protein B0H03_11943 [Rathayibacter iranicus NCPPB 2253 = VKM Ac-1602]
MVQGDHARASNPGAFAALARFFTIPPQYPYDTDEPTPDRLQSATRQILRFRTKRVETQL